jgi:hypothetical protein
MYLALNQILQGVQNVCHSLLKTFVQAKLIFMKKLYLRGKMK